MPKKLLRKGKRDNYRRGHGGARPGSGPKPEHYKEFYRKLADSAEGRRRLTQIIKDEIDENGNYTGATKITEQGVEVPVRANEKTYLAALEFVNSYIRSKAKQEVDVGLNISAIADALKASRKERGLDE